MYPWLVSIQTPAVKAPRKKLTIASASRSPFLCAAGERRSKMLGGAGFNMACEGPPKERFIRVGLELDEFDVFWHETYS